MLPAGQPDPVAGCRRKQGIKEMNGKDIVVIGAAIVDCVMTGLDLENPVTPTGYHAESTGLFPGGEALNQSIILKRLGMEPHIVCGLGTDGASEILVGALKENGVDISHAQRRKEMQTPVTVISLDEKGERRSITNNAHAYNFRPDRDLSWANRCDAVSLASLFRTPFNDPEVIYAVVSAAGKNGCAVYADTKLPNFNKLTLFDLRDSMPMIDCIFPNEREAQYYSGVTFEKEGDVERAADVFLENGIGNVIIKLGADGCFFKNENMKKRLPAFQVEAVDATGAGDNFAAGFIAARSEGMSDEAALSFASACGALCATKTGAVSAIRDRKQVEAFYKSAEICSLV